MARGRRWLLVLGLPVLVIGGAVGVGWYWVGHHLVPLVEACLCRNRPAQCERDASSIRQIFFPVFHKFWTVHAYHQSARLPDPRTACTSGNGQLDQTTVRRCLRPAPALRGRRLADPAPTAPPLSMPSPRSRTRSASGATRTDPHDPAAGSPFPASWSSQPRQERGALSRPRIPPGSAERNRDAASPRGSS